MEQLYDGKQSCFGCGACAAACPENAIVMEPDVEGFLYPRVTPDRCTDCGRCKAVCPAGTPLPRQEGSFYAVRCREEETLLRSTSGGAFSLLARQVLNRNGLVCGAVFGPDFSVKHLLSRDIAPMRKSKYVQSNLADCYEAIREALGEGQEVLFTGTPCQCHGMKRFFPEADGLILVSLICRGVQSPGLWQDYIAHLSQSGPLEAYDFRDKRLGNDGHGVSCTVAGVESLVPMSEDGLSRIYNQSLTYRPSCYSCPYTRADNDFDLTIGDLWGVEQACPRFADGRGTSLVIARGPKGEELAAGMAAEGADVVPCNPATAMQPALTAPAKEPFLRKFLFRDYAKKTGIPMILKKYGAGALAAGDPKPGPR